MSVNKVILVGNVGKNPEIRYVDSRPCATFSLATTERGYRSQNGTEVPDRTEWHNIVMWDRNAEIAERYVTKGQNSISKGNCAPGNGRISTPSSGAPPRFMSTLSTSFPAPPPPHPTLPSEIHTCVV